MEKPTISESTREKLEEAAVSVFMDQYANALYAGMDQKAEESMDEEFPPELEKRCLALIQKESEKAKKNARRTVIRRVLNCAASVAVITCVISSILFVSVEAFRLPIINFFIEKTDSYWQINSGESNSVSELSFNPENPLDGIIPEEFVLVNKVGAWGEDSLSVDYINNDKSTISLFVISSGGFHRIDSENASNTPYKIVGHEAVLSTEGNTVRVIWLDEIESKVFTIRAKNVAMDATIGYAEALADLFD